MNVLRGLAFLEDTEQRLSLQSASGPTRMANYLHVTGVTPSFRVNYDTVLDGVLATVGRLRPVDVLPPDKARVEREERVEVIGKRIIALTARQRALTEALADPEQDAVTLLTAAAAVKADLLAAATERERLALEEPRGRADALARVQTLVEHRAETQEAERPALDARIAAALPLVLRRVNVYRERIDRTTQVVRLTIILHSGAICAVNIDPRD